MRRTLAPRGETPVLPCWDRRDRISAISCITLSPVRDHPGLYFELLAVDANVSAIEVVAFLQDLKRHLPGPVAVVEPHSVDSNLWGRSLACGVPQNTFTLTKSPAECPSEPAYLEIAFESGTPTMLNGVPMPLTDLVGTIGMIAGAHGVGRLDVVASHRPGARPRRLCEAPAAVPLHAAHAELQNLTGGKEAARFSRLASLQYADLIESGEWFTPLREALDAFVAKMQERVTGAVRLRLFKGECRVVGRELARQPAVKASGARRLRVVAAKTH